MIGALVFAYVASGVIVRTENITRWTLLKGNKKDNRESEWNLCLRSHNTTPWGQSYPWISGPRRILGRFDKLILVV